jgi:alkylated DNA repair protein (DNA oxidative demethylase)
MSNIDATSEAAPLKGITMAEIMLLNLDLLRLDEAIQTREVREGEALDLLREIYRDDPAELPAVIVYRDEEGVNWLADGFYRYRAASEAGAREIRAEVREGTKRDAILYAAEANKHGQSLSSAEKRRVVQRLLQDPEWRLWSDRQIARHTGTSHVFVGDVRKGLDLEASLSGNDFQIAPATRTVQRGTTTYDMDIANIGHADGGEGMEVVVTKGLDRLKNAWRAASPPTRRSFREWVNTQPLEDLAVGVSSEKTRGYSAVIANACRPTALLAAPAPEGFDYIPDFLSPEKQVDLLHELRPLPYEQDEFRKKLMKRLWAQFGYNYVSTGQKLTPAPPIPPFLQRVIEKARPYYPPEVEFDQCIVTLYPENAGIGWHTDSKRFSDWILGVSLASPGRLQFRPNKTENACFEVTVVPGSLYVMHGVARWDYQHRLVPVKQERYSLTFRSLA